MNREMIIKDKNGVYKLFFYSLIGKVPKYKLLSVEEIYKIIGCVK